jgi:Uma2 family endonuclease
MPLPQILNSGRFSYADYLTWPDEERWELIDGVPYSMSPAPLRRHQDLSRLFERQIDNYLQDKTCTMYHAPFDVRLSEQANASDNYTDTVVQPDILVVCDKSKLDQRGCNGAPDLIVEIISPSTASRDMKEKFELYQRFAVKEYWLVHPNDQTVMVFKLLDTGLYGRADMYAAGDLVQVPLLGELEIDLAKVFAE